MARKLSKTLIDELKKMLVEINQRNATTISGEKKIDVQIRDNYFNIYYRGSNSLRVKGVKKGEFDEFYFYNQDWSGFHNQPKNNIENDVAITGALEAERNKLMAEFNSGNYKTYFDGATKVIDRWLESFPKPEREAQHKMVVGQTLEGYTIIDIEFAVSTKSAYSCSLTKKNKKGEVVQITPRFDIIAVNGQGELCVIELKKGTKALTGTSGLAEHWECFKHSVGDSERNGTFIAEVRTLLEQKQELELIGRSVSMNANTGVKFMFAYEYSTESELDAFDVAFQKIADRNKMGGTLLLPQ